MEKVANKTLIMLISQSIDRLLGFVMVYFLVRNISVEEYANWSQLVLFGGGLAPLILFGTNSAVVKFFPGLGWMERKKINGKNIILISSIFFIVLVASNIFFETIQSFIFGKNVEGIILYFVIVYLAAEVIFEYSVSLLRADARITNIAIFQIFRALAKVALVWLTINDSSNFEQFLKTFVAIFFIINVFVYYSATRMLSSSRYQEKKSIKPDQLSYSQVIIYAAQLTMTNVLVFIKVSVDRLVIVNHLSVENLSAFALAQSFIGVFSIIYTSIGFVLLPLMSIAIANNQDYALKLRAVLSTYTFAGVVGFIFVFRNLNFVVIEFAGEEYLLQRYQYGVLFLSVFLIGLYQFLSYSYILRNRTIKLFFYYGIGVVVHILTASILLDRLELDGVLYANFASVFLLILLLVFRSSFLVNVIKDVLIDTWKALLWFFIIFYLLISFVDDRDLGARIAEAIFLILVFFIVNLKNIKELQR